MSLTGYLLRNVLVFLLLTNSCGKHRCNYNEILGSYTQFILVELQNLNLTASVKISRDRDICPSGEAHRILLSIYGATKQLQCQGNGTRSSDLEKPLERMEQLITHNCRPGYLGRRASCSGIKKTRGGRKRRIRLIKVIKSLITCWQKLQTVLVLS